MIRRFLSLVGLTVADLMILLGFLSIVFAMLLPSLRGREDRGRLDAMLTDVATLHDAAVGYRASSGAWPVHSQPGEIPAALSGAFPGQADLAREGYTMQWASFEVVDREPEAVGPADPDAPPIADAPELDGVDLVPVVRRMGGIVVHTTDPAILSELVAAYGTEASFARDNAWTLVLPERSESR